jgi:broad specificity phosphatase PhoE
MATQLYLIRHGETAWSLTGQHTGRTDLPLTLTGEQMAARLRDRLSAMDFAYVFTSPLERAHRTCELAGWGGVARVEPDLQEWDYGAYEGRTSAEIRAEQPGWDVFRDGCPQGESVEQVTRRADQVLNLLRPLEGTVAVFSHGHYLRVLAMRWLGFPIIEGRKFPLDTGSVSLLTLSPTGERIPMITYWNLSEKSGLA